MNYEDVAQHFSKRLNYIFTAEETLKEATESRFGKEKEFDRTKDWNFILQDEFARVWFQHGPEIKVSHTAYDVQETLKHLWSLLDYNIFTQVALNLQPAIFFYSLTDDPTKLIEERWEGKELNPLAPKAKLIKEASSESEKQYNMDVSTLHSLEVVKRSTPIISYRVSPKGSTPAFADSQGISGLGAGADQFFQMASGFKTNFFMWPTTPQVVKFNGEQFCSDGIPYGFSSSSGGIILNEVLFVRKLMYDLYGHFVVKLNHILAFIPRIKSLQVVFPKGIEVYMDPCITRDRRSF